MTSIEWPELEEYPLARDAVALLTFDYDRVGAERMAPVGSLRWRVELYNRPQCEACGGDGIDPERAPLRCRKCNGVGRQNGQCTLRKVVIVYVDGRIRTLKTNT